MSDAGERLLDRSVRYLLDAQLILDRDELKSPDAEETALKLGRSLLSQINKILKLALDLGDLETFRSVETDWQEIGDPRRLHQQGLVQELSTYRHVLSFGLAMWAIHLSAKESLERLGESVNTMAVRILSSRFNNLEDVFETYERANERDEGDRAPWGDWLLMEKSRGKAEAHFIETSPELLFTALLLAVAKADGGPVDLQPRDWFDWRKDEIEGFLARLREEGDRFAVMLGLRTPPEEQGTEPAQAVAADWGQRVDEVEQRIEAARTQWREQEKAKLRESPLEEAKVEELRSSLLNELVQRRYVRHIFAAQEALRHLSVEPEGHEARVARNWIPKNFLTADSHVVGIDMAGRDLARATLNEEAEQLLRLLADREPRAALDETAPSVGLEMEIAGMREEGFEPTLLLLPISWRLRERLGLPPIGRAAEVANHRLVPASGVGEFAGIFDDVPVLDAPQVKAEDIWLIDLPATAEFQEWPSERDSGVTIDLRTFDAAEAEAFLIENEGLSSNMGPDEAKRWLQEHVLFTQKLCWRFEPRGAPGSARRVQVPQSLRFDP